MRYTMGGSTNAERYEEWRTGAWMLGSWLVVSIIVGGGIWWLSGSVLYGVGGFIGAFVIAFVVTSYLLYGR